MHLQYGMYLHIEFYQRVNVFLMLFGNMSYISYYALYIHYVSTTMVYQTLPKEAPCPVSWRQWKYIFEVFNSFSLTAENRLFSYDIVHELDLNDVYIIYVLLVLIDIIWIFLFVLIKNVMLECCLYIKYSTQINTYSKNTYL